MSKAIRPSKRYELPDMRFVNDTSPMLIAQPDFVFAADDELDFFCDDCQNWVRIIKQTGQRAICSHCGAEYRFTKKGNIKRAKKG